VIGAHAVAAGGEGKQTVQESHREKVVRIANSWVPALLSGSVERNLAFYTDDVVLAGGRSQEVWVGRAQVKKLLTQLLGDTSPTHCSIKVQGIDITDDWAELRAKFKAVWEPKKESVKLERGWGVKSAVDSCSVFCQAGPMSRRQSEWLISAILASLR